MTEPGLLSVIIPCRNEQKYIASCLDSIAASDYPKDRLEVIVVDGISTDDTRGILADYCRTLPYLKVIDNPRRLTPCALNLAIQAASGSVILRMDAHARVPPSYLSQCVAGLAEHGADNVGGVIRTVPQQDTFTGRLIVRCLSHRFGVGNSAFRTGVDRPSVVDTVFGGCYRRDVFDRIGYFNERLARSQDIEFNLRLKQAGGKTVLIPAIVSDYYARSEFVSFAQHNYQNGKWSVLPFLYSPIVPVGIRHLVPLAFVCALAAAVLLALTFPAVGIPLLLAVTVPYMVANLAASAKAAAEARDIRTLFLMPVMFATLHISYGLGSLAAVIRILFGSRPRLQSSEAS